MTVTTNQFRWTRSGDIWVQTWVHNGRYSTTRMLVPEVKNGALAYAGFPARLFEGFDHRYSILLRNATNQQIREAREIVGKMALSRAAGDSHSTYHGGGF